MARKKIIISDVHNFKNGKLEQDNIYVNPRLEDIALHSGFSARKGLENFLVVDDPKNDKGSIVNIVSNQYGFMPNEKLFPLIEDRLDSAGIGYAKRSINRDNRSFAVDYILQDENLHVKVKKARDIIKPMIRVINSYDGSNQTTGHFGGFRETCSNGQHIAETVFNFQQRHRGNVMEIVIPKIEDLLTVFMDNEYYSIHKKFQVLAEKPITNLEGFVKYTLGQTGLFKYEKSEKSPDDASAGAQWIMNVIKSEALQLDTAPNLWLGYNAFNEYVHTQTNKVFMEQERSDKKIFNAIMEQVN